MHKSADQMIIMIEQCDGLMNQQARIITKI